MKRWLSLILALLLGLSLPALSEAAVEAPDPAVEAPAPADEPPAPPTFGESLAAWAAGLDPSAYDLRGEAFLNGETYAATLRQSDALAELDVPGLGTLQLDPNAIVLNAGGQTYALDLAPMLAAAAQAQEMAQAAPEDAEILGRLLERAAREVLLPSVEWSWGYGGGSLHLSLNGYALCDRLYAFIGSALESDDAARLYSRYGEYIRMLAPECPESFEALREAWSQVSLPRLKRFPDFTLEADVLANSFRWQMPEIACVGRYSSWRGQTGFSLDLTPHEGGFSLSADLNAAVGLNTYNHSRGQDIALNLDVQGGSVSGTLTVGGEDPRILTLGARLYPDSVTADLSCRSREGELWSMTLEGQQDTQDQTVTGSLVYAEPDAEPQTVAALDAHYWNGGLNCTLRTPAGDLEFRAANGLGYTHIKAGVRPLARYAVGRALDLWLFGNLYSGYRVRCETTRSRYGQLADQTLLNAELRRNGASISVSNPLRRTATEASAWYTEQPDGYEFRAEYSKDAQLFLMQTGMEKLPFSLRVSRSGDEYTVSYTNTERKMTTEAETRFELDGDGGIAWLEGDVTRTRLRFNAEAETTHISYAPGRAVITGGGEEWTLERAEQTDRALAYSLTSSREDVPDCRVALTLDDDLRALTLAVTAEGAELGHLRLAEAARTEIVPIDTADAIPLDAETLVALLQAPGAKPAQAAPAAAVETEDEAAYAVEEAAETIEDAVEEAAEEAADAVEEAAEAVEETVEEAVEAVEAAAVE